jgi:hypothetical protein
VASLATGSMYDGTRLSRRSTSSVWLQGPRVASLATGSVYDGAKTVVSHSVPVPFVVLTHSLQLVKWCCL